MRSLIIAELAERALVNENVRAAELQQIRLQERLEKAKSEVLIYRETVKRDEEAVKSERDRLETKEAYLKSLKQVSKSMAGKPSAMEKQLDKEIKRSSDLNAELEKDKQRVDAILRHARALEEEVKRPYDLPNLEKRYAELQEEVKSKEEAERAIDEELRKARSKKQRAAQDELNAFIVQLAKLNVEIATIKKQNQEFQDEIRHAEEMVKASATTQTLQLYPVVKTPQSKSCSVSLDASTSFHFETLATPSTSKKSISMGAPARLEKEPPPRSAAPSMSPLLMPPPNSAVARPRPAAGGPKPESLTLMRELQLLLESATSPKPAARKRPVSSTSVDLSIITPSRKQPRIHDGGALSSTTALKPPHQQLHVPPNERASPSLAARATPAPPGTQHEVASAPAHQATSSQPAAANAALPFGKQTSPRTLRDKRFIPAPPMNRRAPTPNDQRPPGHGRQQEEQTHQGAQISQPPARQHLLEQLSTASPSRTAQPLLQSLAKSSSQWSRELQKERPFCAAQPTHPPDDQHVVEEVDLPSSTGMAQREPAKSTTTSAKWIAALQEQQLYRTARIAKPASGQQALERLGLPGPSRATQRQAIPHPSTALSEASRGLQEWQSVCAAELAQPPKQGHMLEQTPTLSASHMGQRQAAQSPVTSAEWNALDTQSPEQGEIPKPTDSQSSKESQSQSEFSFGAAAMSPGASGEDAGFTLFGEDDNSEGGGFLSMGGANDSAPKFTF